MESNAWVMSESAKTDGYRETKTKTAHDPHRTHVNVALTLNCHLQASLTFAFEST